MNTKKTIIIGASIVILTVVSLGFFKKDQRVRISANIPADSRDTVSKNPNASTTLKTALMAGGCFWCVESDFEKLTGVTNVVSGYAGGTTINPTYSDYAEGGHREVVEITYNPSIVSYENLVLYLIKHGDPTDGQGSFHDRGLQYSPAVYYESEQEKNTARAVIAKVDSQKVYDKPLDLAVLPRAPFYAAEDYHQDYYKKNPIRYQYYRNGSGRDAFVKKYWGNNTGVESMETQAVVGKEKVSLDQWKAFKKPDEKTLRALLTPIQYNVTQEKGTESPFTNEYAENTSEGIYVDIVSGEPLYSSKDKFDSGTGWPSFVRPITPDAVVLKDDTSFFYQRTEVRSKYADSHIGHVFDDGPIDRGGKRYCMNSAALRFIPKAELEKQGYGNYLKYL